MKESAISFWGYLTAPFDFSWEQRKLGELVDRVVRKNTNDESTLPLTISAQYGLVDQITYFNNRVASRDVSNYYLVLNGEFAYNKSTSDGYPFGAVKRLDLYEKGVLSTLYIVFAPKKEQQIDSDYLTVFFDTDRWHKGVAERAAEGARNHGLLNISAEDFFDIDLSVPKDIVEQKQIGAFIRQLDNLITLHQRKCANLCSPSQVVFSLLFVTSTFSWEQRKAIDIADYSKGNGYSKGDLTDAGTPIILYGRLYTKYQFAISEVDTFAFPRNGAVYSQGNEVIVPASGETAEDIARASAVEKSGVLLGGDLNILRPFDFINPLFLALAISNGEPQKELAKKAQGKSVVHIHNTDIQEVTIAYPSRTEQDRIVSVFRQLDNLITLHQRKFEKLTNVKKSMLEKMFPQNGSSYPEIRFKGFTDPWEQRKFEEIAVRSSVICSDDTLPRVEYEDIVSGTGRFNKDIYAKQSIKSGIAFHQGDVLYGKLRPYLQNWLLPTFDGLAVGDFWVLQPQNADSSFLYRLIQSRQFDEVANQSTGTKMPRADWKLVSKTVFSIPSNISEQAAIGTYFTALDSLITLHQRELEKLQNIKKSMLEKMFV